MKTQTNSDAPEGCAPPWPFVVTIDRNKMERRYVLKTVDATDGLVAAKNDPMTGEEFREHYGFSEEFPHEFIQPNSQAQARPELPDAECSE